MKINTPVALLMGAGFGLAILLLFGTTLTAVKGLILTLILYYASLSDLGKREVPNYLSAMIVILAFVGFDASKLPSMLIGAAVVFLPQFIISLVMKDKANGGADIKLSTAAAFMLGAEKGIFALIVGLLAGVLTIIDLYLEQPCISQYKTECNEKMKDAKSKVIACLWFFEHIDGAYDFELFDDQQIRKRMERWCKTKWYEFFWNPDDKPYDHQTWLTAERTR